MSLRKHLYFAYARARGWKSPGLYKQFLREDQPTVPHKTIEEALQQRLVRLLNHCRDSVPYYAKLMAEIDSDYTADPRSYLQRFPILTKDILRNNFEQLTSKDLKRRKWFYNTSGGSTGEPARFIQDNVTEDYDSATLMVFTKRAGKEIGELEVKLWGSERDIFEGGTGIRKAMVEKLRNRIVVNAFRLSQHDMLRLIEVLNTKRPQLILSYAQSLHDVARFALQERIFVHPQKAIMTSASMLYPFMREEIESVFGCRVFDQYGSREAGAIGCQCDQHRGLHVVPWKVYVEVVNDDGEPVPPGSEGHILITSLNNYSMPLVRYKIGDRGLLDPEPCPCGRGGQVIERMLGRSLDVFYAHDGTSVAGGYFFHLLFFKDWVRRFQVVQEDRTHVLFRIALSDKMYTKEELDEIVAKTKLVLGEVCNVRFEFVDDISPTLSGKYRYTVSHTSPAHRGGEE